METQEKIDLLIIEKNAADAKLLQLMLEGQLNINIRLVDNYRTVLNQVPKERCAHIIMMSIESYNNAKINGLRQLALDCNSYIFVVTGLQDRELATQAIKAGASDIMVKGHFSSEDLIQKIELAYEKHKQGRRLKWLQRINRIGSWSYSLALDKLDLSDTTGVLSFIDPSVSSFPVTEIKTALNEALSGKQWQKEIVYVPKSKNNLLKDKRFFQLKIEQFPVDDPPLIIRGTIQDISDKRQADELQEETHQKYVDIFANSSDGIYLSTLLGQPQECNNAGLEILGITENELQSHNLHHFYDTDNSILELIGQKKPIKNQEIQITQKNGNVKSCLLSVVYFSEESNMYTGILRDITERKAAEKIRRTQVLEMESNQLKEQFVAAISHEMRTPMNAIIGLGNLLLDTSLDSEQRGYLKSIHSSSEQLLGILNDILDISSLKNGNIVFENKNFDVHDLLNNLVHNLSYKVVDKDVSLELSIDPDLPHILKGDKLRINQVLFNLAGNAVKFTDQGHVKISCSLLGQSGDTILIKFAIEDTGIGIPKEKQDAIFDSFTRIKHKERIFEGTGLGLAISKNLITQQGGKIWVSSTPGKGSTFFFDMVLEIGDTDTQEDVAKSTDHTTIINPKRILIVEDNKMNQLVARKILAKRWPELEIIVANDGVEALDVINEDFDLVLMDLYMPRMDGYEATKAIRDHKNPKIQALPVLAMTADAQIQEGDKHKEYQLDDFIVKPFDPGILYEKILNHLNQTT